MERNANATATSEVTGWEDMIHAAYFTADRVLEFHDWVRPATMGRSLVYLLVNPDGTTWKIGQTGQRRGGVTSKNPGWSRIAAYRRLLNGKGCNPTDTVKYPAEFHAGGNMFIFFTDQPLADEAALTRMINPTESGRQIR